MLLKKAQKFINKKNENLMFQIEVRTGIQTNEQIKISLLTYDMYHEGGKDDNPTPAAVRRRYARRVVVLHGGLHKGLCVGRRWRRRLRRLWLVAILVLGVKDAALFGGVVRHLDGDGGGGRTG